MGLEYVFNSFKDEKSISAEDIAMQYRTHQDKIGKSPYLLRLGEEAEYAGITRKLKGVYVKTEQEEQWIVAQLWKDMIEQAKNPILRNKLEKALGGLRSRLPKDPEEKKKTLAKYTKFSNFGRTPWTNEVYHSPNGRARHVTSESRHCFNCVDMIDMNKIKICKIFK